MPDLGERLQAVLGGDYQLQGELGGAGMSRVYVAEDTRLGRSVVVKVLPPDLAVGVKIARFQREIALAAKLQHPHIVPLLSAGAHDDLLYYTMPHIEGQSLRAKLSRERLLSVGEALLILREVCDALAYAHANGIVHRDIKPDNILLSGNHALVTDFGVAKAVGDSSGSSDLTTVGVALGTPAYMAPEQASGDASTDHRADIYAVGILAYEMLTGRTPFAGPSAQTLVVAHLTAQPESLSTHRSGIPPALESIVLRCLAKQPAERWQSAVELLHQLDQLATPISGTLASNVPLGPVARRWTTRLRARPALPLLVGSAAALALVYAAREVIGLPDWVLPSATILIGVALAFIVTTALLERGRGDRTDSWRGLFTWRSVTTGAVVAFALLGLATAGHMAMRVLGIGPATTLMARGTLEARDRVVLADFENHTNDITLGPSVGEALRVDLAQSRVVRPLDASAISEALRRMHREPETWLDVQVARDLAQREGAKAVVRGRIDPVGRGYVVTVELLSAADGTVLVALRESSRDDSGIIDAVDRLSKRLRERIGESLRAIHASEPLERVTTSSLEALRRYSEAIRVETRGEFGRAIALLQEAVALDSGFAMAHRKLAVIYFNSLAAPSQISAAATNAFRHRDRLPPLERALATAYYYSQVDYDPARIERGYRAALDIDPDDFTAGNNLSMHYVYWRRYAEAESLALRHLGGRNMAIYVNTARAQVGQGKFAAAATLVRTFEANAPGNPGVLFLRALLAESREAYDSADGAVRELRASVDLAWQATAAWHLAALADVRGKLAAAETEARRFMDISEQRHLPAAALSGGTFLGFAWLRLAEAPTVARRSVTGALARYPLASIAVEDRPYATLAWFFAEAGDTERAQQLLDEYATVVPERVRRRDSARHAAAGAVAFAAGRLDEAVREYRAWHDESGCVRCGLYDIARVYDRGGRPDSALAYYEQALATPGLYRMFEDALNLPLSYRRLGELYEQRGQSVKAREYYGRFVALWKDADPRLQRQVRDVENRMTALAAERP